MSNGSFHQILPCRTTWNGTAGALQGTLEECASMVARRRWKSRACVLTPDGRLLVYVGLCAGRPFNLRNAKSVVLRFGRERNGVGYRQPNCLITVRSDTGPAVTLRVRGEYNVAEWSQRVLTHAILLGASRSMFVDDKNTQTTLGIDSVDRHFLDRLGSGDQEPPPVVIVGEQFLHPPRSTPSLMQLPFESTSNVRSPPTRASTAMVVLIPNMHDVDSREPVSSESENLHTTTSLATAWHSSTLMTSISTKNRPTSLLSPTLDDSDETAWPDPPSNLQLPITPEWMSSELEAVNEAHMRFAFPDDEHNWRPQLNTSPGPISDNVECGSIGYSARGKRLLRQFGGFWRKIRQSVISSSPNTTDC